MHAVIYDDDVPAYNFSSVRINGLIRCKMIDSNVGYNFAVLGMLAIGNLYGLTKYNCSWVKLQWDC